MNKVSRLTGLGLRDSFLPRFQALQAELEVAFQSFNYLLYEVDAKPDPREEDHLSTLGYVKSTVEDMVKTLGNMR